MLLINSASCNSPSHHLHLSKHATERRWMPCRSDSNEHTIHGHSFPRTATLRGAHSGPTLRRYRPIKHNDTSSSVRDEYPLLWSLKKRFIRKSSPCLTR